MIIESGLSRLKLGRGEVLSLHHADGDTVVCYEGCLWVTRDHDIRDVILTPGQRTLIDGPGRVLIQSFENSQFAVGPASKIVPAVGRGKAARPRVDLAGGVAVPA